MRPSATTVAESGPTVTIGGPSPSAALSTPSSPPSRQVLTSFKAFGATPSTGVFGAPVLGSSPAAGAFRGSGGMARGGGGEKVHVRVNFGNDGWDRYFMGGQCVRPVGERCKGSEQKQPA